MGFWMYLIYACTGLTMALFVYYYVPETKGLSLEDIDILFGAQHTQEEGIFRS